MNKFSFCTGIIYLGAAIEAAVKGQRLMAGVFLCYSASSILLAFVTIK